MLPEHCRDGKRRTKVQLELNLMGEVKDNRKDFFRYISSKRKTTKNVSPLQNEVNALVREDTEKEEIVNVFFDSVLTKTKPRGSQSLGIRSVGKGRYPLGWEGSDQRLCRQT